MKGVKSVRGTEKRISSLGGYLSSSGTRRSDGGKVIVRVRAQEV